MTTRTPETVKFDIFAQINRDGFITTLPAIDIVVKVDVESNFYATATLTLSRIADAEFAYLDPRQTPPPMVDWRVDQLGLDSVGAWQVIGTLPESASAEFPYASMVVRRVVRNVEGTTTVELAGMESVLAERKNKGSSATNTGATTVANLVTWAVLECFPGATLPTFGSTASSTSIPAGDRRLFNPKESYADLIQPELDAIAYQLVDFFGRAWTCGARVTTSSTVLKLATYKNAPSDADPIVTEVTEEATRDEDWYDAVLIEYTNPTTSAVVYHGYSSAANSRTLVLERDRPAPAIDTAQPMQARTLARGYKTEIVARARFGITLGEASGMSAQPVWIYTPPPPPTVDPRIIVARLTAVEWRIGDGEMTLTAQTGNPIT